MLSNLGNIEKVSDLKGLGGSVYAAETLSDDTSYNKSFLTQYQAGIDVLKHSHLVHKEGWLSHGYDDNIPYVLRSLYQKSSIHNSAINIKAALIHGDGFEYEPLTEYFKRLPDGDYELVELNLSDSEKEQMVKRACVFARNKNLKKYATAAAHNLATYGGYFGIRFYMPNLVTGFGNLRRYMVQDATTGRLSVNRQFIGNDFQSTRHYFCDDFMSTSAHKAKPYKEYLKIDKRRRGDLYFLPVFDGRVYTERKPTSWTYSKYVGRMTQYRDYYGTADYETEDAIRYIEIDNLLSQADYKDINTGFSATYFIVRYRARLDDSQKEKAKKEEEKRFFKSNLTGPFGDRSMMLWVQPDTNASGETTYPETFKFLEVPSNYSSDRYNILREERTLKILSAHNITSSELIGLPKMNKTGFSNQSEYLITAQTQLYQNTIKPYQDMLCMDIQDDMINEGIFVKPIPKNNAANYRVLSDKMMTWMLGVDEARQRYDIPRMSEEVAEEVLARTNKIQIEDGLR